jgi:hypothetical protein
MEWQGRLRAAFKQEHTPPMIRLQVCAFISGTLCKDTEWTYNLLARVWG